MKPRYFPMAIVKREGDVARNGDGLPCNSLSETVMHRIEPRVEPVRLADLRPTQFCVGFAEVDAKRKRWAAKGADERKAYLASHMIPVVAGPKGALYPIDHHHEGLGLLLEGQRDVLVQVQADLRLLGRAEFWQLMVMRGYCYLYDEKGRPRTWQDLPHRLADMADDPFRSLAGQLREVGGYAKSREPFSEFQWANWLRTRLQHRPGTSKALTEALDLARSRDARHLPGWCGPA